MRNVFLILIGITFLISCEKEEAVELISDQELEASETATSNMDITFRSNTALSLVLNLILKVDELRDNGATSYGPAQSIIVRLRSIKKKLEQGKIDEALEKLDDLRVHLTALADEGTVDATIIDGLLADVDEIICEVDSNISCGCPEIQNLLLVTLPDGSCLYVHPIDNSYAVSWEGPGIDISGIVNTPTESEALADFSGISNTQAIMNTLGSDVNSAAKVCADLEAYGYNDWYLPAYGELYALYQELGPVGSNGFFGAYYWSSSEESESLAWSYNTEEDFASPDPKNLGGRCRCVRK